MAQNHIQSGKILQYTNSTESTITSGTPVVVGTWVGVALGDIADGATGSVAIEEVWDLPKEAEALTQGAKVYLTSTGKITATSTDNTYAGKAFETVTSGEATVPVKINA